MIKKIVISPENRDDALKFFEELTKSKEAIRAKISSKKIAERLKGRTANDK